MVGPAAATMGLAVDEAWLEHATVLGMSLVLVSVLVGSACGILAIQAEDRLSSVPAVVALGVAFGCFMVLEVYTAIAMGLTGKTPDFGGLILAAAALLAVSACIKAGMVLLRPAHSARSLSGNGGLGEGFLTVMP